MSKKLNELSKKTLGNYIEKAADSGVKLRNWKLKSDTRKAGIKTAVKKLTKEETMANEDNIEETVEEVSMVELALNEDVTNLAVAFDHGVRAKINEVLGLDDPDEEEVEDDEELEDDEAPEGE
jgi:predicted peroxiredoxin